MCSLLQDSTMTSLDAQKAVEICLVLERSHPACMCMFILSPSCSFR